MKEISQFGRLTLVNLIPGRGTKRAKAVVHCECGSNKVINKSDLFSGKTLSCGCLRTEKLVQRSIRHGHARRNKQSPTYLSWFAMIQRCTNKHAENFSYYGGRGITVCKRWLLSFEEFLKDMGQRPQGYTLDRINVNGNYCLSNCRWATVSEQLLNRRKNT